MKLKHTKKLVNGQFEIIMSVSNFSILEVRAMKAISEPNIVFSKTYGISSAEVNIDMPITRFVNQRFVLNGNVENIVDVALEAKYLIEDIREAIVEVMAELVGEYEKLTSDMKFDQEEEIEIGPKEDYPDWEVPKPDKPYNPPGKPDEPENPDEPVVEDDKCSCNCGGIKIGEEIPDNLGDGRLFGIILPDDED